MVRISAVVVEEQGLRIGEAHWPWPECQSGSIRNLLVAGAVTLNFVDGKSLTVWGSSSQARALHARIEATFGAWALASRAAVVDGLASIRALLGEDRYLSRRVLAEFRGSHPGLFGEHVVAGRALANRGDAQAVTFLQVAENLEGVVDERNARWSFEEQVRWGALFDTVEKKPLTDEQRPGRRRLRGPKSVGGDLGRTRDPESAATVARPVGGPTQEIEDSVPPSTDSIGMLRGRR